MLITNILLFAILLVLMSIGGQLHTMRGLLMLLMRQIKEIGEEK
jgi:hypothetical protein